MQLIPTHNKLRDIWTFKRFVRQFKRGVDIEKFGQIPVVITEDNCCYVWDGHHRLAAMSYLGLRIPLSVITPYHYTYKQLMEINFTKGYVTPFNPKTECRLSFHEFKDSVLKMYKNKHEQDVLDYIWNNENLYKEGRDITNFYQLIPEEFKSTCHANKWS